jgi:phage terminase large subunit-like protein
MTVIPFGQGFSAMSGPSKEFERLVFDGKYQHGGNPVTRWMADAARPAGGAGQCGNLPNQAVHIRAAG